MTTSQQSDDAEKKERAQMPLRWQMFLVLLFYGPALYFGYEGDYVVAAVCSVSGLTAFMGFRIGAVAILGSIGAIAVAIAFAPEIGYSQEFRFTQWFGTTGLLNRFLCMGVIGVAIALGVTGVVMFVARKSFRKRRFLDRVNRWSGFGIGVVEGLVVCLFFLGGMFVIDPTDKAHAQSQSTNESTEPILARAISKVTESTRSSRLGPFVEENNPFVHFPELNKVEEVQKSVVVLSDPESINRLLNDPSILQLQQRPEVRTVIRKLKDDPKIRDILQSGRLMDRSMVMTLLEHPAVLELLDQPGFMDEAKKVIQSTNMSSR